VLTNVDIQHENFITVTSNGDFNYQLLSTLHFARSNSDLLYYFGFGNSDLLYYFGFGK